MMKQILLHLSHTQTLLVGVAIISEMQIYNTYKELRKWFEIFWLDNCTYRKMSDELIKYLKIITNCNFHLRNILNTKTEKEYNFWQYMKELNDFGILFNS